jgi:ABC-type multidrug transport system fused ATPase/permease subunit
MFNRFNSLSLSNGVNINSGDIQNILQENVFTSLGIYSNSFIQNFNITFVIVFLLPFVIGLISILVAHFFNCVNLRYIHFFFFLKE